MANPMLAVLAVVLVSAGTAGVALHAMDTSTPTTISGTVTAVEWNPHFNATVEFKLRANDTNHTVYDVEAGPPWYWAAHDYPMIKVNDTVKVEGVVEGTEVEAHTLWINGGTAIVLWDGNMPAWAIERSGQTPNPNHGNETENETDS